MLTLLGTGMVAALLLLILFRITSVLVALTLVPLAAALAGGFAGSFGTWAMDGIRGVTPVAPSAVAADGEVWTPEGQEPYVEPRALETDELEGLKQDYVQAAERIVAAGGDGVELHAANGYLLHQFLGTNTNVRTDGWGGDARGRQSAASRVIWCSWCWPWTRPVAAKRPS